jgi:hypothetical protein
MKSLLFLVVILSFLSCSSTPQIKEDRGPASFQSCLEAMGQLLNYRPVYGNAGNAFSHAKNFTELESFYGGENLIEIQRKISDAEILANNAKIKKLAVVGYKVKPMPGKSTFVSETDTKVIYRAMEESNVNKNHYCYDTKQTIGFCFGRATIAHMEAIVRNVHPDLVKKIWIAGDMGVWGHHVATMVYTKGGWMVLDTNIGHAIPVGSWIDRYMPQKQKGSKEIMAFVTQAGRFGPYDNRPYNAIDLFNTQSEDFNKAADYFNGYFHDYFDSLDNVRTKPLNQR